MTESRLQHECFIWHWNNYPDERGLLWMNYNNPKNAAHGAMLKGMGLIKGVADMTYVKPSRCADCPESWPGYDLTFIELKTDTGRQSSAQKEWQAQVEAVGAKYEIVRTVEEFKALVTG